MPTTLSSFADTEIRMRYREPFLTEGLDLKLAVNTPPGIYRGFRLATHGSSLTVSVVGDAAFSDHAAVYQAQTGHSLTLRRTGGTFSLSLAAFVNKTVVIAIYCTYTLGSLTTGELRVYELAPTDEFTGAAERPELVVLGTVVVPAAGVIPAANITAARRVSAWATAAPEATQWTPLVKNGGFELSDSAQTYRHAASFWELTTTSGGNWRPNSGGGIPHNGSKALELNVTASPITASATQRVEVAAAPGRMVRVEAWVRSLIAPTVSALVNFVLNWGDATGADLGTPTLIPLVVVGATDGAYRLVETVVEAPATAAVLKSVEIRAAAQTYGSTGVALRIDDVQVFVEVQGPLDTRADELRAGVVEHDAVILEDPTTLAAGQLAGLLRFDKATPASEGRIVSERRDRDYTGGKLPPALAHFGRLVSLGSQLLGTAADARKARISTPYHTTFDATLIWESTPTPGTTPSVRLYVSLSGLLIVTINAFYDGTSWNKDSAGSQATLWELFRGHVDIFFRDADAAWTTWSPVSKTWGPRTTTLATPFFEPLYELFDSVGNRRVAFDHLGFENSRTSRYAIDWVTVSPTISTTGTGFGSASYQGFQSGPGASLGVQTTNDSAFFEGSYQFSTPVHANSESVLEFEVDATDIAGTPPQTFEIGWKHDQALPSTEDYVKFSKTSASANWQFMTRSTGLTFTQDTGVAATGVQRFRIEWYGSAQPGGARALGYINGVLVGESNNAANLPDGDPMPVSAIHKATGVSGIKQVRVSPFVHRRRRILSDDQL